MCACIEMTEMYVGVIPNFTSVLLPDDGPKDLRLANLRAQGSMRIGLRREVERASHRKAIGIVVSKFQVT